MFICDWENSNRISFFSYGNELFLRKKRKLIAGNSVFFVSSQLSVSYEMEEGGAKRHLLF